MSKKQEIPEFSRSTHSYPVTLADGTKTHFAHQLKYGRIPQSYWYYLQWECGGWREFDVRWLFPEAEQEALEKRISAVELHRDPTMRDPYPLIHEILKTFTLEQVKRISL